MNQLSEIPFANISITVYNKYQVTDAYGKLITKWLRTVLPNCKRSYKSSTGSDNIQIVTDTMVVQIPMFEEYLEPYDFNRLTNEEMITKFTLNEGDLVITREVADEPGEFEVIEDIENRYGSLAFKISNISLNYGDGYPLPHIEVS